MKSYDFSGTKFILFTINSPVLTSNSYAGVGSREDPRVVTVFTPETSKSSGIVILMLDRAGSGFKLATLIVRED